MRLMVLAYSFKSGVSPAQSLADTLVQTPAWMFLLSVAERCFAIAMHMGLSSAAAALMKPPKKRR